MSNKKKIWIISILILLFLVFIYGVYTKIYGAGKVYVLSVSTDGNYAITTDWKRMAILWDLKNHKKKILDRTANIYSAYFIKNSRNFMWQHDANNEVIIENVSGKIIKKFNPGFPTYGQVITSDLNNYFASDDAWNIYKILFAEKTTQKSIMKKGLFAPDFFGSGKLINFNFSFEDKYILTSGFSNDDAPLSAGQGSAEDKHWSRSLLAGVVLWNTKTSKPIMKYPGNVFKTIATLSPDGKYVVAGDENSLGFVWNAKTGKRLLELYDLISGYFVNPNAPVEKLKWNKDGLIPVPKDFVDYGGEYRDLIFAVKFIDKNHYLRFTTNIPQYAILYKVTDPKPLKYIKLGKPDINVDDYTRDQSIDTSPSAHILVTGKMHSGGILVYKYDPEKQTLTKIWNGR